jgi:HD superfamily phosphohydrolase
MFKAVYFHKTVRSGEVMLLHSMKIQNEELHFTDFRSLEDFFSLHDEMVLEKLTSAILNDNNKGKSKNIEMSIALAKDYQNRNLLKCIYEFFLLTSQRNKVKSNNEDKILFDVDSYFDHQLNSIREIVDKYQQLGYPIFLDVSRAPQSH